MLRFLQQTLFSFRDCFSRKKTFNWFVVVIAGFIVRIDKFGVTSIIRGLMLLPKCYEPIIKFFHSTAWNVDTLTRRWWHIVLHSQTVVEINEKLVLLADHCKVPKEGRKMPGVSTLHQDSETSSKPSFFRGHFWGTVSILTGKDDTLFSTPMLSTIHQNLNLKELKEKKIPCTERIVNMALDIVDEVERDAYLILDAFFAAGPVFAKAMQNVEGPCLTVITPAKSNTVGYLCPTEEKGKKKRRGPRRKYGPKVEVDKKFGYWSSRFKTTTAEIYGHKEQIRYYSLKLIWKPVGNQILFVWSDTSRGKIVLMCSDLNADPVRIIELYCKRAKIETFFYVLKTIFGGHQYHFWSKHLAPKSRRPKKNKRKGTSTNPKRTIATYEAIHRFFNLQCITIGILQMISLKFPESVVAQSNMWMRTQSKKKPSEFRCKEAMKNVINQHSIKLSQNQMIQLIREKQKEPDFDENLQKAA